MYAPTFSSGPSFEFEERPNWCNALHAVDEIEDQELDNLIACALFHAKQAFRGLAGELDRRVRGWIRANSTMGAGALHKWAAKDSLAHAFHSKLWTLREPGCSRPERCWDSGGQSGAPVGSSTETVSFNSVSKSVNYGMKFGAGASIMAWWEVFIPIRCEPRPDFIRPKLAWERTDGERKTWPTYRSRRSRRLVVSWRRVNVSWPGRRNGWQFSPLCSLKVKSM